MGQNYYLLSELPDLSLNKYSSLDESGVEGVLKHHTIFWRQMHRRGILAQDSFHIFYMYDPTRPAGKKLQIGIRFDTEFDDADCFIEETIQASPLSPFFTLRKVDLNAKEIEAVLGGDNYGDSAGMLFSEAKILETRYKASALKSVLAEIIEDNIYGQNSAGRVFRSGDRVRAEFGDGIGSRYSAGDTVIIGRKGTAKVDDTHEPYRVPCDTIRLGISIFNHYRYNVHLIKKEIFTDPLKQMGDTQYYTTSQWEMNEEARLYTMTQLMAAMNRPCLYCVSIFPKDLTQDLAESLTHILSQLRQVTRAQINARAGSVGVKEKDENASTALDFYTDFLESLGENPHFLVDAQVLSDDMNHAAYVLDAAASEALDKGSHELRFFEGDTSLFQIPSTGFESCADERAPQVLLQLPHLFLLEEMTPFCVFPTLYPGEWVELPKETAPKALESGLLLGKDEQGHDAYFPLKNLSKHAFLAGVPGSGKTNSMMHLIHSMHANYHIPVLILEPAKHEYRAMLSVEGMEDLELFSPSASTRFPIHINPFEFPQGMTAAEHIRNLMDVFNGAFALDPPMPFLLDSSIEEVYRDHNWVPAMINCGKLTYPTMGELYKKLEEKLEKTDYAPEIQGNLKSALQVRIGSLLTREMGDIFDVPYSTIAPEDWLTRSAIIELESMGKDPANFTTLLVATLIRETLKVKNYIKGPDGRPRHVMFFEEAHNLIGPNAEPTGEGVADPKVAATAYIVKMLAEVRALGEGIVIADQLPTAMAPEVIKNTSLKIALRITAQDDRELLGSTMNAGAEQLEKLSIFTPGHALTIYEDLLKPFEVQIPYFEAKEGEQDDSAILQVAMKGTYYWKDIFASLKINVQKWDKKLSEIKKCEAETHSKYKEMVSLKKASLEKEGAGTPATKQELLKILAVQNEFKTFAASVMEDTATLLVMIAAYLAPFKFLATSNLAKTKPQACEFLNLLSAELGTVDKYRRAVTERMEKLKAPIEKEWLEKFIQRKDILLQQGVTFDNL